MNGLEGRVFALGPGMQADKSGPSPRLLLPGEAVGPATQAAAFK